MKEEMLEKGLLVVFRIFVRRCIMHCSVFFGSGVSEAGLTSKKGWRGGKRRDFVLFFSMSSLMEHIFGACLFCINSVMNYSPPATNF